MRATSWDEFPKRKVDGRWLCRWCGSALDGRRTAFCGQACEDEVRIRCQPSYARVLVFVRDQGVCCRCRLDTEALRSSVDGLVLSWRLAGRTPLLGRVVSAIVLQLEQRGFTIGGWRWQQIRSFWEADHIVPVSLGGGGCGLDNYRTLCLPCHRLLSAKLARWLADDRRGQTALFETRPEPLIGQGLFVTQGGPIMQQQSPAGSNKQPATLRIEFICEDHSINAGPNMVVLRATEGQIWEGQPNGEMRLNLLNPHGQEFFVPGQRYVVTLAPPPQPAAVGAERETREPSPRREPPLASNL